MNNRKIGRQSGHTASHAGGLLAPFMSYAPGFASLLDAMTRLAGVAHTIHGPAQDAAWAQFTELTGRVSEAMGGVSNTAKPPAPPKRSARTKTAGFNHPHAFVGLQSDGIASTVQQVSKQAAASPLLLAEEQAALARDLMSVLAGTAEVPADKRFDSPEWSEHPFYRTLAQSYLAWSNAFHGIVDKAAPDERSALRMGYLARLLTDALAPSNTLLGNPVALKQAVESGGVSIMDGLHNALDDLVNNDGMPSQVDKSAFTVGGNLAVSPGAVVFRNPVLELIQYSPTTPEVHARPQLLVPPHVNKFYLVDMAPKRSMVEYLVGRGFQVFVVSWRNPGAEHRDWDLNTFAGALKEAIDVVREVTGSADLNVHGICGGARILTALLGHLAGTGQRVVNAATLVVCMLISTDDPLGPFGDEAAIAAAKRKSQAAGVLDGSELGRAYTWAKPADLVWNYWINNYLMGKAPPAYDILFWNADTTRMTAGLHAQLLDVFSQNLFAVPGGLTILGTPVDLSRIDCDTYVVGGLTDHIGPWQSVYNTVRHFGGHSRFILSSGGHVQSIITPADNRKVKCYINPDISDDPDQWMAAATETTGSWWLDWAGWMAERSGPLQPAPTALGNTNHPPLCPAPGSYVLQS